MNVSAIMEIRCTPPHHREDVLLGVISSILDFTETETKWMKDTYHVLTGPPVPLIEARPPVGGFIPSALRSYALNGAKPGVLIGAVLDLLHGGFLYPGGGFVSDSSVFGLFVTPFEDQAACVCVYVSTPYQPLRGGRGVYIYTLLYIYIYI